MQFRLKAGIHIEPIVPYSKLEEMSEEQLLTFAAAQDPPVRIPRLKAGLEDEERRAIIERAIKEREIVYHWQRNPIIDCEHDLIDQFGPEKFERVHQTQYASVNPTSRTPGESDEQYQGRLRKLLAEVNIAITGGAGSPIPPPSSTSPQDGNKGGPGKKGNKSRYDETLNVMNEQELRKFAAEEEINLPAGVKGRDQVLSAVKAQLGV